MADALDHGPHGRHQSRKATANGWIGSALEYYDAFIYAAAAALVFPQVILPKTDERVAVILSLLEAGLART